MTFRAWRVAVAADAPKYTARVDLVTDFEDESLGTEGEFVDVDYSSINFKDGLALTGRPGVIRGGNLIAGIDLVGRVSAGSTTGDTVIVTGWGIGENTHGGLSERARVKPEWMVPLPAGLTAKQAAAIGTAGFTAMLAVLAIEKHGAEGEVLVTGASGGVGSLSIAILSKLGCSVTASTGKADEHDYLRSLGATTVIDRAELSDAGRPLQTQRWGAVIDSVGGATLANAIAQTNYGGLVASCGLAQSADLPTTVMPFILRGVTLAGINSVFAPAPLRTEAWARLATDLDLGLLDSMTTTIPLAEAVTVAERIVRGEVRGRTVVDVRN
jgi:acrylyl-CoA reductase (NADPH)